MRVDKLQKLELELERRFSKHVPFSLPREIRKTIAHALWLFAAVFGVLQLWTLFDRFALRVLDDQSRGYGDPNIGFFYHLSLVVLAVAATLLLVAAPSLKAMRKDGWDLAFYAVLVNAVYGVVRLFAGNGGFGALLWALITSAVAAYVLFQVRGFFVHKNKK